MSEIPAKPQSGPLSEKIRFDFSPMQSRAVLEAARVQEISQKYIDTLNSKILELTIKTVALRKDATDVDAEILSLKKEADGIEKSAKDAYTDTLSLVMGEFDTPEPPWEASIVMDKGIPLGVDLLRNKPKLNHTDH